MQIIVIFSLNFGQSLYSGQAAKCSKITLPGHGLDATSGQEHAEAGQEHAEAGQKYAEGEHKQAEGTQIYNDHGVQFVPSLVIYLLRLCIFVLHL